MNASRRVVGDICGDSVGEVELDEGPVGKTLPRRAENAWFCLMVAGYQVTAGVARKC
jgi:hypothetical protein